MTNTNYVAGYRKKSSGIWSRIIALLIIVGLAIVWLIAVSPKVKEEFLPPKTTKPATSNTGRVKQIINNSSTITNEAALKISDKKNRIKKTGSKKPFQKVLKATICKSISVNNTPIHATNFFEAKRQKIYHHVKIKSKHVPSIIKHVWFNPQGMKVGIITLNLVNKIANTYSYYTITGAETGKWTIKTIDKNNNILSSTNFIVGSR